MIIEADVLSTAKHWGLDRRLLQAIDLAEGGGDHLIKAIQCSYPNVRTRAEALDIAARTIVHRLSDFLHETQGIPPGRSVGEVFIAFLAQAWAPLHADNDPTGLNKFWPGNVTRLWLGVAL